MIILDTHVWIWHVSSPEKLSRAAQAGLQRSQRLGVSAISCWEVAMLVAKKRLHFDRPVLDWIEQALALPRIELCPITPAVAVQATAMENFHGDPADRIIAATAYVKNARLVTKDEQLRAADMVDALW